MDDLEAAERDLHAFIDCQLPAMRRRGVMAYLDAHPEEAERVAAYLHQRADLMLLRRCLAGEPAPTRLAGREAALLGAMRRQRHVRRADAERRRARPREGRLTLLAGEPS